MYLKLVIFLWFKKKYILHLFEIHVDITLWLTSKLVSDIIEPVLNVIRKQNKNKTQTTILFIKVKRCSWICSTKKISWIWNFQIFIESFNDSLISEQSSVTCLYSESRKTTLNQPVYNLWNNFFSINAYRI